MSSQNGQKIRIGDVAEIIDGAHATPKKTKSGKVYLGIRAISEDGKLVPDNFDYLSDVDFLKWSKRAALQKDDVIFSYEATLNRYAIIPENLVGCLGRRLAIVRIKDRGALHPKWLYYYFQNRSWQAFIENNIFTGSTVNRVSIDEFPDYTVFAPDIDAQKSIAHTLSLLDDKIALNHQINSKLEALARYMYDYWFVQFDFPDANNRPYKTAGGAMVYNAALKREIPAGWQVKSFLDIADWTSGAQPPKSTFKYEPTNGYVRFIQNRDYASDSNLTFIPVSKNNKLCDEYDIMMDKYGEAGRTRYGLAGAYNVALARIVMKHDNIQEYLRSFLSSEPIFQYLYNACMASTRASLNADILSNLNVVVPPAHLLLQYEKLGKDVIGQTLSISNENKRLVELRDWLLPMLMNGQVKVAPHSVAASIQDHEPQAELRSALTPVE